MKIVAAILASLFLFAMPATAHHEAGCIDAPEADARACHRHTATDNDYELSQCDDYGTHWARQDVTVTVGPSGDIAYAHAWDEDSCKTTTRQECETDWTGVEVRQGEGYNGPSGRTQARTYYAEQGCNSFNTCQINIFYTDTNTGASRQWTPIHRACPDTL